VLPAQQGFETCNPVSVEVDQGLKVNFQFASSQGSAEFYFHRPALLGQFVHRSVKEMISATTFRLCPVERHIGILEQIVGAFPVGWGQRYSDACTNHNLKAVDAVRQLQGIDQAFGYLASFLRRSN